MNRERTALDDLPESVRTAYQAARRGDPTWMSQVPSRRPVREWAALLRAIVDDVVTDVNETPEAERAPEVALNAMTIVGFSAAMDFVEAHGRPARALVDELGRLRAENERLRATNRGWSSLHEAITSELAAALAEGRYRPRPGTVPTVAATT